MWDCRNVRWRLALASLVFTKHDGVNMHSFIHIVMNAKGSSLEIRRTSEQSWKIIADGVGGERVVIEVDHVRAKELRLEGLTVDGNYS